MLYLATRSAFTAIVLLGRPLPAPPSPTPIFSLLSPSRHLPHCSLAATQCCNSRFLFSLLRVADLRAAGDQVDPARHGVHGCTHTAAPRPAAHRGVPSRQRSRRAFVTWSGARGRFRAGCNPFQNTRGHSDCCPCNRRIK
eukprot:3535891-Rhodomonas_salina.1